MIVSVALVDGTKHKQDQHDSPCSCDLVIAALTGFAFRSQSGEISAAQKCICRAFTRTVAQTTKANEQVYSMSITKPRIPPSIFGIGAHVANWVLTTNFVHIALCNLK
jgi:hypothetical protein